MPCKGCGKDCKCTSEKCGEKCSCGKICKCHVKEGETHEQGKGHHHEHGHGKEEGKTCKTKH